MDIIRPDKHTFSLIRDFLGPYEEKCVLLCSNVRKEDEKIYVIVESEGYRSAGGVNGAPAEIGKILGVLRIDSTLFHFVPEENLPKLEKVRDGIFTVLQQILGGKKIKCISGEAKGTDFFTKMLQSKGLEPFQINKYNLMKIGNMLPNFKSTELCPDDQIVRFTVNNLDELLPMQKKYLQEEVAPGGKKVSDLEVRMTLKQILKNQLCLVVISDGEIAAKANTNAIGMKWVQIGGVYTNFQFRRRGYSKALVSRLCYRALKVGKNVVLFVKEKNLPAIELYKNIGFENSGKYQISYF